MIMMMIMIINIIIKFVAVWFLVFYCSLQVHFLSALLVFRLCECTQSAN